MKEKIDDENVLTQFKGPGQWRSQAARLERDNEPQPWEATSESDED